MNSEEIKMYGYNSLLKKEQELNKEKEAVHKKIGELNNILSQRFFKFLQEIFYEYTKNNISFVFQKTVGECKLFDIQYEPSYWITFIDKFTNKEIRYLVHYSTVNCNILDVYEKIQTEIVPIYEKNKKLIKRERDLVSIVNKNKKKKEDKIKEKI